MKNEPSDYYQFLIFMVVPLIVIIFFVILELWIKI